MKNYVVIGNGVAGATAVDEIRKKDRESNITIFTEEHYSFYYRPKLPFFMAGKSSLESFTLHTSGNYREEGIDLHLDTKILSIDPGKKKVKDSRGNTFSYDALLLASGASAMVPAIPGTDKQNIFTLRTVNDAIELKKAAEKKKKILVIGGGLLGLEAAHGLIQLGSAVEVIEYFDRLLPKQMDPRGALFLRTKLEHMGFSFRLGVTLKEITGGESVSGIVLDGGEQVDGYGVLFSAGIKPNLGLAEKAGINIGKSIKVNEYMETNISGIWAAGDAAEFNGVPGGLWVTAMHQGKCAGLNMAGEKTAYKPSVPSTTLKVAGINLVSSGNIDPEGKLESAVYENGEDYRKIVLEKGLIRGFIFLGNTEGASQCAVAMNSGKNVDELKESLIRADFDFSRLL